MIKYHSKRKRSYIPDEADFTKKEQPFLHQKKKKANQNLIKNQ